MCIYILEVNVMCFFQGQVLEIKLLFWVLKHSLKYPPPPPPETPTPLPTPRPHPHPPAKKIGSTSHVSLLYVDVQCNDMVIKKERKRQLKNLNTSSMVQISLSAVWVWWVYWGWKGRGGHAYTQGCFQTALTGYDIYVNFLVLQVPVLNKQKKSNNNNKTQQHVYKLVSLF